MTPIPWLILSCLSLMPAFVVDAQKKRDDLRVLVVDRTGAPVPDLDVVLVRAPAPAADPTEILLRERTDANGSVVMSGIAPSGGDPERGRCFVRLAIPARFVPEFELRGHLPRSGEVRLVLPACGEVVFAFPEGTKGEVLAARAGPTGERPSFGPDHPLRARIQRGKAILPRVGLGLELDYEARLEDGTRVPGRGAGPTVEGGIATIRPPVLPSVPVIVGRVLREDLTPVANLDIEISIADTLDTPDGTEWSAGGRRVWLDANGGFHLPIPSPPEEGAVRLLEFRADWRTEESMQELGEDFAVLDLSRPLERGIHPLGDVVLAGHGAELLLGRLDDDGLLRRYDDCQHFADTNGRYSRMVEACLREMARRGGDCWCRFLEQEWRRESRKEDLEGWCSSIGELEFLTALRRAQRRPDPLVYEVTNGPDFWSRFPDLPVVEGQLRNQDGEPVRLTWRFASSLRVAGREADGTVVPPREPDVVMYSGVNGRRALLPGETEPMAVDLSRYLRLPHPGEYTVWIQYHDQGGIEGEASAAGYVVSRSEPFTVLVDPLPVVMTRAEQAQLREWIYAMDPAGPVILVDQHWPQGLRPADVPQTPRDHLFWAGYPALPVLIGSLSDPEMTPDRRAWVFALLWNIVGMWEPFVDGGDGAVGSLRQKEYWTGEDGMTATGIPSAGAWDHALDVEDQAVLTKHWQDTLVWLQVEITD